MYKFMTGKNHPQSSPNLTILRAHDQPNDDVSKGWMPTAGGPRCLVFLGLGLGAMTRGDAKKHTHTKWNILIYCNMYFFLR